MLHNLNHNKLQNSQRQHGELGCCTFNGFAITYLLSMRNSQSTEFLSPPPLIGDAMLKPIQPVTRGVGSGWCQKPTWLSSMSSGRRPSVCSAISSTTRARNLIPSVKSCSPTCRKRMKVLIMMWTTPDLWQSTIILQPGIFWMHPCTVSW